MGGAGGFGSWDLPVLACCLLCGDHVLGHPDPAFGMGCYGRRAPERFLIVGEEGGEQGAGQGVFYVLMTQRRVAGAQLGDGRGALAG